MLRSRLIITGVVCLGMLGWATAAPPRDPQPYVLRAEAYALKKQWAQAESCLRQAQQFAPNDPDLLAAWAWLAWRQHGDLRGQVALVAALRADRTNVSALLLRSEIREEQGNGTGAIEDLRMLLGRSAGPCPGLRPRKAA